MRDPRRMSERELQDAVLQAAKVMGWLAYHTFDSRRSGEGFPDIVLVHPKRGVLLFVELKSETGQLTLAQKDWRDALEGIVVYLGSTVWRPSDLDTALATLGGVPRGPLTATEVSLMRREDV